MKRMFRIFELSKNEQRVVLIVIIALIGGALVGYERRIHARPAQATTATESKASPSPPETEDEQ
jgi:hypothetical protein